MFLISEASMHMRKKVSKSELQITMRSAKVSKVLFVIASAAIVALS
jgi:hypothetical protein